MKPTLWNVVIAVWILVTVEYLIARHWITALTAFNSVILSVAYRHLLLQHAKFVQDIAEKLKE